MKVAILFITLLGLLAACSVRASIETGAVEWQRDFDAALVDAEASGKPVFLLFQEVPGCAGCQQFGKEVLSDPRLVAVIEREFVPVLVRNNVGGKEREILKRYNEPAWNFQVVRFLDAQGKDLIARKDRVWETVPLAMRMQAALEAAGRPVPEDLADIVSGKPTPEAEVVFAMYCFWTGEAKLGALEGVTTTEAGFYDGREVTRVKYAPSIISTEALVDKAKQFKCADKVYLPKSDLAGNSAVTAEAFAAKDYRVAPRSDQKKQLSGTPLQSVQLSPEQATKANAWIRRNPEKALSYLSAEQRSAIRR
ncbi:MULTISPECIES: VPGUxxT family thioredoxin-like (seleno)protein, type 2 [unclassified Lentimonas]|uniref:VPGUxxT family thioredoxin-like (seleno)protein, type 2 n=1 Tax=unclassified Lentimonas TaxID=2630993 RepID=UPI001321A750|nr:MULTISPECIES: VPGUxxT family thioredoxin-like (seleno)protein, type 2 [unclassified Lentimonas]CAA6678046.1 Unannotated [Lentimonas sp. CC4]CAA6687020.1 Unannotated [Lentimonas sp. CC6]CAA7075863.1 Unannotated [Lentimonas sp. CC4]CAA7172011.1 Unannotated [Lentimonas sp. CC21]CAA7182926.1 Unannotated [Lentimonas sp. CC8]